MFKTGDIIRLVGKTHRKITYLVVSTDIEQRKAKLLVLHDPGYSFSTDLKPMSNGDIIHGGWLMEREYMYEVLG